VSKQSEGVDMHPVYQRACDWPTIDESNVDFFIVQLSKGGRPLAQDFEGVTYTPDAIVRGVRSLHGRRKLGGYHFALNDVSPENQAAVFAQELQRHGALDMPPFLDLEKPFTYDDPWTIEFGKRFLLGLKRQGFPLVGIYGNAFFLSSIKPHQWGIPGLLVWGADYAMTDGVPNPLRYYDGPLDIRQYYNKGKIPGIGPEFVDLNRSDLGFLRFAS
jgi:GH25 family lysozyme M1 (1,4-beta-N-acetylmuramidase)